MKYCGNSFLKPVDSLNYESVTVLQFSGMKYWLMKTEPEAFSIDDLVQKKVAPWDGVRNYQARNFMRDEMCVGDKILFYHSSTEPAGIAGLAEVSKTAYPDPTQWDPESPYFDPKSGPMNPRWVMVDVKFVRKFSRVLQLSEMRSLKELSAMLVLKKGMRLSIQPVDKKHYEFIVKEMR